MPLAHGKQYTGTLSALTTLVAWFSSQLGSWHARLPAKHTHISEYACVSQQCPLGLPFTLHSYFENTQAGVSFVCPALLRVDMIRRYSAHERSCFFRGKPVAMLFGDLVRYTDCRARETPRRDTTQCVNVALCVVCDPPRPSRCCL